MDLSLNERIASLEKRIMLLESHIACEEEDIVLKHNPQLCSSKYDPSSINIFFNNNCNNIDLIVGHKVEHQMVIGNEIGWRYSCLFTYADKLQYFDDNDFYKTKQIAKAAIKIHLIKHIGWTDRIEAMRNYR